MPDIIETTDAVATSATTYVLGLGQTAQGELATGADRDWFAVSLTAGQTYTFAMTGTGTNNVTDTYLRLYSTNGVTLLRQVDDGLPNANSLITFRPNVTGTYYLAAGSFQDSHAGQYGLSFSSGNRASFDTEMGGGVIDSNASWSAAPGTGASVTYGFRQSAAPYSEPGSNLATFTPLTAEEIAAVEAILQVYSELCGITFVRVNPAGLTNDATMLFANYNDPNDGAGAFAYYPGSTASNARDGDVWLNLDSVSATALPPGSYSHLVLMHEIGHALGLSHPGLYDAAPNVDITYANHAQFVQDSEQYSLMSYFAATETGAGDYASHPNSPMLFDVLALHNIYGANTATRAGDTVYGFNSTAGPLYDFAADASPAFCIWDGGGADTLDASSFFQNQTIDLRQGAFSSIGGIAKNISIALGAVIENASGGTGNDTLTGNDAPNLLSGGAGNDTLTGGLGNDTLRGWEGVNTLNGGGGDDTLVWYQNATGSFDGGEGRDTLSALASANLALVTISGIEILQTNGLVITATASRFESFDTILANELNFIGRVHLNLTAAGAPQTLDMSDELVFGNQWRTLQLGGSNDAERIISGDADDMIFGGGGDDVLDGGKGDDWLRGDLGNDTADYSAALGGVTVDLSNTGAQAVSADRGIDTLESIENLIGSSLADTLSGDGAANSLTGGGGNDTLNGAGGADSMAGGAGNDTYGADDSGDSIAELVNQGHRQHDAFLLHAWRQSRTGQRDDCGELRRRRQWAGQSLPVLGRR